MRTIQIQTILHTKHMGTEYLDTLDLRLSARLVLVEEIAAE